MPMFRCPDSSQVISIDGKETHPARISSLLTLTLSQVEVQPTHTHTHSVTRGGTHALALTQAELYIDVESESGMGWQKVV